MSTERIQAIDAARGTAMLLVFLSHFANVYFVAFNVVYIANIIYGFTMMASPAFLIISGSMLGFLYHVDKDNFALTKSKLVSRSLFLLTVGHILILLAHIQFTGGLLYALRRGFATDTIGGCILFGTLIVEKTSWRERSTMSVLLFALSWIGVFAWIPDSKIGEVLKEILLGPYPRNPEIFEDVFPFLPWFSLYLFGTCIGEGIGRRYVQGGIRVMTPFVFRAGWSMLLLAITFRAAALLGIDPIGPLGRLVSLSQKLPPSPGFYLFYGGLSLAMLHIFLRFRNIGFVRKFEQFSQIFGQASLFTFIIQYYVYFTFFDAIRPMYSALWPFYFLASVAFLTVVAWYWRNYDLTRFLTIPYVRIWRELRRIFGYATT